MAAAIATQSKDKRLIEVEIATKIAERMTSWVKAFGFFLAAPAALVLILLGIIGISKFQDVQTAADAVDKKVISAQAKLDTALGGAQAASERAKQVIADTKKQLATLQATLTAQGQQLSNLDNKITQLAERPSFGGAADLPAAVKEKLARTAAAYLEYIQKLYQQPHDASASTVRRKWSDERSSNSH